jgi:hypothetical protein
MAMSTRDPGPDADPDADPSRLCGWIDDPARHAVAATLPTLAEAGTRLAHAAPGGALLLYRAWRDATGAYWPYAAQTVGDCVSHGHGHGYDLLQCVEHLLGGGAPGGLARDATETDTEFLYGVGREAAGMLGSWGDGCYGAAMVKAMTGTGVLPRSAVGPYDGQRARRWGHDGAPADLKTRAARWKLGNAALVRTWDELLQALGAGYPVTVCTALGFTLRRDDQGFCRREGRWGHCMLVCGARQDDRPGACVFQSWGPNVPSGPTTLDQPDNTFWIDRLDAEAILAERDSWALAKGPLFVPRPLPAHWSYADYV